MLITVFLLKSTFSSVFVNCCLRILFLSELPCQEISLMRLYLRSNSFVITSFKTHCFTSMSLFSFR